VCGGHTSLLDKPGIDLFKRRLGFVPHEANFVAVVHPWLRPVLLSKLGHSTLVGLKRLAPQWEMSHRVEAVLKMARTFQEQAQ
jgi:hypothetical protein